jgi:hypothetical protein
VLDVDGAADSELASQAAHHRLKHSERILRLAHPVVQIEDESVPLGTAEEGADPSSHPRFSVAVDHLRQVAIVRPPQGAECTASIQTRQIKFPRRTSGGATARRTRLRRHNPSMHLVIVLVMLVAGVVALKNTNLPRGSRVSLFAARWIAIAASFASISLVSSVMGGRDAAPMMQVMSLLAFSLLATGELTGRILSEHYQRRSRLED